MTTVLHHPAYSEPIVQHEHLRLQSFDRNALTLPSIFFNTHPLITSTFHTLKKSSFFQVGLQFILEQGWLGAKLQEDTLLPPEYLPPLKYIKNALS